MAIRQDRDLMAILWFNAAVAIMAGAMMATVYPWIVPHTWTIYTGASPAVSLFTFTLAMGGFFPVMLMYNAYQIWVFRARISALAAISLIWDTLGSVKPQKASMPRAVRDWPNTATEPFKIVKSNIDRSATSLPL